MAYKSALDLKLPQQVDIPEEYGDLFINLQGMTNAIHLLNAAYTPVADYFNEPDINDPPHETVTFAGRMFWGRCADNVVKGRIVKAADDKWRLGAAYRTVDSGSSNYKLVMPFGLTLSDPQDGKILIGIPPGIIPAEGVIADLIGKRVYTDNSGEIAIPDDVKNEDVPIGIVVEVDNILITYGALR